MTYCTISIRFDKEDRIYHPSERIMGTITVQSLEDCDCRRLLLGYYWGTHGKGNYTRGYKKFVILTRNEKWRSRQNYEYKFNIAAPQSPFSYHGHYLNVDWYLTAQADLSWGMSRVVSGRWKSPKRVTEFLLKPANNRYKLRRKVSLSKSLATESIIIGSIFSLLGIVILVYSLIQGASGWLILSLISLGIGGFILFFHLNNFLAEFKMGQIDGLITSIEEDAGLRAIVRLRPRRPIKISSLYLGVVIQEEVTEGSGSRKETHKYTVLTDSVQKSLKSKLDSNRESEMVVDLPLPDSLPVTFSENDNKVKWQVTLKIKTDDWFDWSTTLPIDVNY